MLLLIIFFTILSIIALHPRWNKLVSSKIMQDGKVVPYKTLQETYPILMNDNKRQKRHTYIFYHICTQGEHWKSILNNQMQTIIKSGLYDKCHTIWYGCSCHKCTELLEDYFKSFQKVKPLPRAMCAKEKTYENETLNSMIRFCRELPLNEPANCLYIHTKGTTAKSTAQHAWRDHMMHWMVERHNIALDLLERGFYTVGTLYQKLPLTIYGYYRLYSGNFFWVSSEYMKTLPIITNTSNRFLAEQLIFKKYSQGKHVCINPGVLTSVYIPFRTGLYKDNVKTAEISNANLDILIT